MDLAEIGRLRRLDKILDKIGYCTVLGAKVAEIAGQL